jgi:hypothetical protein
MSGTDSAACDPRHVSPFNTFDPDHAMLRGFTDSTGVEWRVWEVLPTRAGLVQTADALARTTTSLKETPFANGWLCFESSTSKRRLAPIPDDWDRVEQQILVEYCLKATDVPLRRRNRASA